MTLYEELAAWKAQRILRYLEESQGDAIKAAKLAGVSRAGFYKMMDSLGIKSKKVWNRGNAEWQSLA